MRTREQEAARYNFLRTTQVAEALEVSRSTVVTLIRTGELAAINVGTRERPEYRVAGAELEAFLERRRVA